MDALAAYGSDSDDSGAESGPVSTATARVATAGVAATAPVSGAGVSKISSLSSMLPPPKSSSASAAKPLIPVATISSVPKTSKYYSMPTLESESDSDGEGESEFRKKAKLAEAAKNAGSGVSALFAMLPAPKTGATPSSGGSGSGSGKAAAAKPSFMPRTVKKATTSAAIKPAVTMDDDKDADDEDEDEDDDGPISFFPLGSAATATPSASSAASGKAASNSYIPLFFDKKPLTTAEQQAQNQPSVDVAMTNEQYAYPSNDQYAYTGNEQYAYPTNDQYQYHTNDAYAVYGQGHDSDAQAQSSTYGSQPAGHGANMIELDDVGLQKLGMRKARDMPINVIDVSARDQMSQAQHMRVAAGSGAQSKPVDLASIEHLKPSAGQKRKHNIMSLAYQAKANEQQLNATWAASRRTKAETQSKYGF